MREDRKPRAGRTTLQGGERAAFLHSILESSTEYSIVAKDLDGTIVAWNEGARRLYGYEAADVVGRANASLLHAPEDITSGRAQAILDSVRTAGKWEGELVRVRKNGSRFTALVTLTLRRDAAGGVIGFTMISRDLTESPRVEQDLRRSEQKFRHLLEAAPDAMVIADAAGRIVIVNVQLERMFGYSREELLGQPVELLIPERYRSRHVGHRDGYAADPRTRPMGPGLELWGLRKDGEEFPVEISLSPLETEVGTLASSSIRDITAQRRLAEELRQTHVYNRNLIESNIDALMTTDTLGIITDVNRQMCEVTGHTREELIGTAFKNYFTEPQRADDGIRKVLAEDRVTNYELTILARDGKETVVSYNATTFRGADGRLRGVLAAARDITEQKVLEEQLRRQNEELEEQYRRVLEANRLKSEFLANMSHELRTPLNGIIGFAELIHDEKVGVISGDQKEYLGDILTSARHLLQLINDVLDLSKVESGKMEFRLEPVNVRGVVGEVCDILRTLAAQKRIEVATEIDPALLEIVADAAKLKQVLYNYLSNALKFTPDRGRVTYRGLFEAADDGFLITDEDHRIVDANPAMCRLSGYAIGELRGRQIEDLLPSARSLPQATERRNLSQDEELRCKSGNRRMAALSVSDLDSSLRLTIVHDITDRRKLEASLIQTEKIAAMGTLLAGVAHELNNPLSVILGQTALLEASAPDEATAQRLGRISQATERCARIIRSFLSLARQRPPEQQVTILNQIVREAVELLAYPLRVDGVAVGLHLASDLPMLWADPDALHQVVVNLISNAHQAMREHPGPRRLTLTTRFDPANRTVRLDVEDTGGGIPPEAADRIFDPFFTTKPPGQGTGLGLSLCRGVVESHGGTITVQSSPGTGAVFAVELPVREPPVLAVERRHATSRHPSAGRTILVVDDEPDVTEVLAEVISLDGHHVETARNGFEALQRLGARAFDLILTDVRMPELDGPGFYMEALRLRPEIRGKLVFLTGDSLSPATREFLERTAAPCLSKPFSAEEVRRFVREALTE